MNLIELAVKATVVLAASGAVSALLRSRSAAVRHMVWTTAIAAVLMLPLLSAIVPAVPVQALPSAATVLTVYGSAPAESGGAVEWTWWLWTAWAAGAAALVLRLAAGLVRIQLWSWRATPDPVAAGLARGFGLRRTVRVRITAATRVPTTWGVLRPYILLPAEAASWSERRRLVVLAHEVGHIRRFDWLTQLLAQAACAVYWFHPLAWYAERQLRRERELACDDGLLAAGFRGSEYAEHLVEIARGLGSSSDAFTVGVAMAQKSNLETRVRAMLNPALRREGVSARLLTVASVLMLCAIAPLAALQSAADESGAKVAGMVYDASGAAVPSARVVLRNLEGRNVELTRTGAAGEFEIASVPAGTYRVEVGAKGFEMYRQDGVSVRGGAPVNLNVILQVGKITESLEIVGQGAAPKAASATDVPGRIKVGGQVQYTKLARMIRPEYPAHLKAQGVEGSVLTRAVIAKDGKVVNLEVLNTQVHPDLAKAATDAIREWRYEPTHLNGEPVEVITEIHVNFTLQP